MILKKIIGVLLIFCMVFGIAACGVKSSDSEDNSDNGSKSSSTHKSGGLFSNSDSSDSGDAGLDGPIDENTSDSGTSDSTDEDTSDSSDSSDSGVTNPLDGVTAVELPDGFPKDAYPFMNGTVFTYGIQTEDNNRTVFTVMATSPKAIEDVKAYYNNLLGSAENKQDSSGDGYFTSTGTFADYDFQIMLMTDSSNKDYTGLTMSLSEKLTASSALDTVEQAELPENYPVSQFPIIDNGKVTDATESESDGVVSYDITVVTTHTFKEIVAFYENSLGDIADKSKSVNSDGFDFSGTITGYSFYINGYTTNISGVDMYQYYISLDPITE